MIQDSTRNPHRIIALPEWLRRIIDAIIAHGFQCYLVGGAVRDALRGGRTYDYDLATDATPRQMRQVWKRIVPSGVKYGTVTLLSGNHHAEVTTFRREAAYRDSRHPTDICFGTDIAADLARRDFTINAIAYDPRSNTLVDPFDGQSDIKRKIIRAVGVAALRLHEDSLRILRAVRLATVLQYDIEPHTARALGQHAATVRNLSPERVREELERIIASPSCQRGFSLLARWRLLPEIITVSPLMERLHATAIASGRAQPAEPPNAQPERVGGAQSPPPPALHPLVARTLALAATLPPSPTLLRHVFLWSACQQPHRPATAVAVDQPDGDERNRNSVLADQDQSPADRQLLSAVEQQLVRLRYARNHIRSVLHLLNMLQHLPPPDCSDATVRYFFFRVGKRYRTDIITLIAVLTDNASEPDSNVSPLVTAHRRQRQAHSKRLITMARQQRLFSYGDLAINGDDLQRIGYQPGALIGEFKAHAVRYLCRYPDRNTESDLRARARAFLARR